jgi:hypothetical protein
MAARSGWELKEGGMWMLGAYGQELNGFPGGEPGYVPFFGTKRHEDFGAPGHLSWESGLMADEIDGVELNWAREEEFGEEMSRKGPRKGSERRVA